MEELILNLESYQYFAAAAEELNFTRAAKRLYITQQALSKQIDRLEHAYNVRLFNRESPMTLTPAGKCLYQYACRLIEDERQMQGALDRLLNLSRRKLIIGASYYRSSVLLPGLLAEYHKIRPEVTVKIHENNLSKTTEALKLGKIDLMFGYAANDDPALVSRPIFKESVLFVLPKTLAAKWFSPEEIRKMQKKTGVPLKVFSRLPFIRLSHYSWLGTLFDRCCKEQGIVPDIVLDSSSILTTLSCCLEGIGITLIPDLYIHSLTSQQKENVYLFRWDYPEAECHSAILYLKNSYLSEEARDFIQTVRSASEPSIYELNNYS